jgi:hypothetical protein
MGRKLAALALGIALLFSSAVSAQPSTAYAGNVSQ